MVQELPDAPLAVVTPGLQHHAEPGPPLLTTGGRIIADGSADQLSRRVAGESEVRWTRAGSRYVHSAADATGFVRELFRQYGDDVADLEVRRASLEDTYMTLVRDSEAGRDTAAGAIFEVVR